ncbi:hypothetical protein [Asticcacaulis sp. 201]|uniref:hypothetical protein n=1 Tax=Asticcacaulis sp. 201 TaxID=3028787 RepID=UPI002916CDAB|nr:hypothetical protein [Asticcacaulis sp. 201]MDV6330085.1 hypothetical protein [Asticcacaulis sp. 201]
MSKRKEYGFQRTWFGSAIPIHPMGILVLFGGVAIALAIIHSGLWFVRNGHPNLGTAFFAAFAAWNLWLILFISAKTDRRK